MGRKGRRRDNAGDAAKLDELGPACMAIIRARMAEPRG